MLVQIDTHENKRIKEAQTYYESLGLETEVKRLDYGDYVFNEKVAFEFKTIPDFVASIQDNRVFNEAINQAENYDWHYVIIMGNEYERTKCLAMSKHYIPVDLFQYHGAIASLNRYTTVIESYSPFINEAFYKMYIQARKDLSVKPIVKKFGRKQKNPALNFLAHDVYGVNYKRAEQITDKYQLYSLTDLFGLKKEELMTIQGIGDKIADNIIEAIHGSQD